MPPKKQDEPKSGAEQCMLKIGRHNNVVQWKEDMQNEACGLYGMTGMFFSTNRRYVQSRIVSSRGVLQSYLSNGGYR